MSAPPNRAQLQADRFTVKKVLDLAVSGGLRLPIFQRPLRWRRADHGLLLDSLYRGFPVGTLLLWQRHAAPGTVTFGPVQIAAPDDPYAYWIVDGQQRITSIVGCLAPVDLAGDDGSATSSEPHRGREFGFCFDLGEEKFVPPPRKPQAHLVPVGVLRDAVTTSLWASEAGASPEQHRQAQAVGERLRTYEIPAYVLRADGEEVLRVVFERTNSSGKRMTDDEIFEALNRGLSPGETPESLLGRMAGAVHAQDFGSLPPRTLQKALVCVAGYNPRDDLPEPLRRPGAARVHEGPTTVALGRAVRFLRDEAGIPHAAALPYDLPVIALSGFFARFASPSERTVELLVRWIWRGIHTQAHMVTNRHLSPLQAALKQPGEHAVVRALLEQVRTDAPARFPPTRPYNPRGMRTRTELAAMYQWGPLHLETLEPLSPAEVFEDGGHLPVLPGLPRELASLVGARFLHPRWVDRPRLETFAERLRSADESALASHGIPNPDFGAVRAGDWPTVVRLRQTALDRHVDEVIRRSARWHEDDDGPPISALFDADALADPP